MNKPAPYAVTPFRGRSKRQTQVTLKLTNTLTRQKQVFQPVNPDRITMYVCGPTVYNYAHIGNARPAVVFDVLCRLLRRRFGTVIYARNLTDVDDKINAASLASGQPIGAITDRFIQAYHQDMAAVGVLPPDVEPRVTDHIPDIIALIQRLLIRGHAYEAEHHVLFHVPSFPAYGRLSGRSRREMIAGARVEPAPFKRDPADFVLWKPSDENLPGWDSPWGRGRPGWHIECSAMIEHHLGGPIDLHGGGQDLIFPHHENEIAQGVCAHDGRPYCDFWVHNGFVTVEGRKMSKSLGNVLLVRDLLADAPGEAIRLALLSSQYRQPLDWSRDGLRQAKRSLDRLYGVLQDEPAVDGDATPHLVAFEAALDDDLNTPLAIAELFRLATGLRQAQDATTRAGLRAALSEAGAILGLLQQSPEAWFGQAAATTRQDTDVDTLLARRNAARAARDYATSDRIRDELAAMGVTVEDRAGTSQWRRTG